MPRFYPRRSLYIFLLAATVFVAFRFRDNSVVQLEIENHLHQHHEQNPDDVFDDQITTNPQAKLLDEWRDSSYVEGQYTKRIIAVGDIHSDYGNALKVLHMAGVVDVQGNWTGNVDMFVQTGDIIDRSVLHLIIHL